MPLRHRPLSWSHTSFTYAVMSFSRHNSHIFYIHTITIHMLPSFSLAIRHIVEYYHFIIIGYRLHVAIFLCFAGYIQYYIMILFSSYCYAKSARPAFLILPLAISLLLLYILLHTYYYYIILHMPCQLLSLPSLGHYTPHIIAAATYYFFL